MDWKVIHEKAMAASEDFRKNETELITVLQEVEAGKIYDHLGLSSLYQYCLQYLKLSEDRACTYIRVARISTEIPAVKKALLENALSISNAKKISRIVTPENQECWLEKAKSLSGKELEKE